MEHHPPHLIVQRQHKSACSGSLSPDAAAAFPDKRSCAFISKAALLFNHNIYCRSLYICLACRSKRGFFFTLSGFQFAPEKGTSSLHPCMPWSEAQLQLSFCTNQTRRGHRERSAPLRLAMFQGSASGAAEAASLI